MHRSQTSKFVAFFLSLCLLIAYMPFSAAAAPPIITPGESPDDPVYINGVSWSNTSIVTIATVTIGVGQTASLSQLGLSAFACSNGQCSTAFTWGTTSSKVTINANGTFYGNEEGMAIITGTSTTFGYGLGLLTLIVCVTELGCVDASLVDAIDDLPKEDLIRDIRYILQEDMNFSADSILTHPPTPPSIIPRDVLMSYIASSRIVYFGGHGEQNRIQLSSYGSSATYLHSYHLDSFPSDIFSRCELLLLDACLTASGGETGNNLINAFLAHGVETVVGFKVSVLDAEVNMWVEAFFNNLANGETVQQACNSAWEHIADNADYFAGSAALFGGTEHSCVVGNKNKTF